MINMIENNFDPHNLDEDALQNIIKSSTTTVAIMVKDGVIIGTESQATAGYTVATKQAQKLIQINNLTAATITGSVPRAASLVWARSTTF